MKRILLTVCCLVATTFGFSQDTYWTLDSEHTTIGFNATHLLISEVSGKFLDFSGTVKSINDENFSNADVALTIFTNSVNTDNAERDKHLCTEDFFNCKKYPEMTFKSTRIRKLTGKEYKVYGDLTINGITKPVTLDLKHNGTIVDPIDGVTKAGFKLSGMVNRYDFGLKWNISEAAESFAVSEEVELDCNIRLNRVQKIEAADATPVKTVGN